MTPTIPIKIQRPPILRFGSGLAPAAGTWARDGGFKRVLVVADAFNAARVGLVRTMRAASWAAACRVRRGEPVTPGPR